MKKNALLCLFIAVTLITAMPAMAISEVSKSTGNFRYDDIDGGWYQSHVEAYGYPEIFEEQGGRFQPDKKITRIQFARLLHRALDIELEYLVKPDIEDFFNDVDNENPGSGALYDLVSLGIIEQQDSFYPDKQLDREIMVHYIINALDYVTSGEYAMIMIMPAPFEDDEKITGEYRDDLVKAVILGLIYGYENNMLHPDQGATRAEAVTVVDRLLELTESLIEKTRITASATETAEGLLMSLTITNNTDKTITINHTSGQKYDFQLIGFDGEVLYTWSDGRMFTMALQESEIGAGESIEFIGLLDSEAYGQIKDRVSYMKAYIVGSSDDFAIAPEGYTAVIS
ncbi:MAG: S-layer protein [Clostridiales bacterium]|nr:S-layer protein [Clostridiales bacterium]